MARLGRIAGVVLFLLPLAWSAAAGAADVAGSKDDPLIGRYEGSEIVEYSTTEFDAAKVITGPIDPATIDTGAGEGWLPVEGKVTLIYYMLPPDRSTLEVLRNYQSSIEGKGGAVAFTCDTQDGTCYAGGSETAGYLLGQAVGPVLALPKLNGDYVHNWFGNRGRYLYATFDKPEGKVHAEVFLGESGSGNVAVVRVVETTAMEADKITFVDASQMRSAIDETGRISLYGILFDFDKATLKDESKPTLDEIAKLLTEDPDLELLVVGHTDSEGSFDYNLDLSNRRAAAVAAALVETYGIPQARLSSFGCSFAAPVASNADEAGRAKNRRVELVQR